MPIRITFLPSLQHMAIVKIAVAVFYNPRISRLIGELQELEIKFGEYTNHQRVREKWALVEKQVHKQLHRRFPTSLIKKITGIMRSLHLEVKNWKIDHEEFLTSNHVDYESMLIWNSDGTIDRSRTAEEWIRSGILDIRRCFLLACTYFMGRVILNLWVEMKVDDKRKLFFETANLAVRFWTDWLREGAVPASWFQIANESLDPANVWFSDYHIRVSCFYDKIDSLVRQDYFLTRDLKRKIHHDDLRFCFNHMGRFEQLNVLYEESCDVFFTFLNWPLQNLFLKLIDNIPFVLPMRIYHWIISYILSDKIRKGWKDADYTEILREIWHRMPPAVKEEMKATQVYVPLMVVLNHTKRQPFSIEEILDSYF